jgi:hypothetical protein
MFGLDRRGPIREPHGRFRRGLRVISYRRKDMVILCNESKSLTCACPTQLDDSECARVHKATV